MEGEREGEGMPGHRKLDRTMFWTGALMAFTPVVIGLGVAGVVLYHRKMRRRAPDERD
jgi:hypothetical protein